MSKAMSQRRSRSRSVVSAGSSSEPQPAAERRAYPRFAVCLTAQEALLWGFLKSEAVDQERGGWDLAAAPYFAWDEIWQGGLKKIKEPALRAAIGRLCDAEILTCRSTDFWQLSRNPQDVHVSSLDAPRRIVVIPAHRAERIARARPLAQELASADGVIKMSQLLSTLAAAWEVTEVRVSGLLLDYPSRMGAGDSLRILVRLPDREGLLLVAPSLGACDFIPASPDDAGDKAFCVKLGTSRYEECTALLQARYEAAAQLKEVQPAAPEVLLPPIATHTFVSPALRELEELRRQQGEEAAREGEMRVEAAALRTRLEGLDAQIVELARRQADRESQIMAAKAHVDAERVRAERQRAELSVLCERLQRALND